MDELIKILSEQDNPILNDFAKVLKDSDNMKKTIVNKQGGANNG